MRLLVVEDDPRVAQFVRQGLQEEHFTVDLATDGEHGLALAQSASPYALIILDVMLPKRDGLDVLRTLRSARVTTPVIVLTAKRKPEDTVEGLEAGADDYLHKPFNFDELLARVHALLRRRGALVPTMLQAGDLTLDVLRRHATRGGRPLMLTGREFAILELLLRHQNGVVTREMLAEQVWMHGCDPRSNLINVYVNRLREKVDAGAPEKLLHTVRGQGYSLRIPASVAHAP